MNIKIGKYALLSLITVTAFSSVGTAVIAENNVDSKENIWEGESTGGPPSEGGSIGLSSSSPAWGSEPPGPPSPGPPSPGGTASLDAWPSSPEEVNKETTVRSPK